MTAKPTLIDQLRIASPCTASWDDMQGDDRVRFCGACQLHVYDLTAMSNEEVTNLVSKHEGRLCGRLYRRQDGKVLAKDCPVGLAAIRRRVAKAWAAATAVAVFLMANVAGAVVGYHALGKIPGLQWLQRNDNPFEPSPARNAMLPLLGLPKEEPAPIYVLGDVCIPSLRPPQPTPPPTSP